ncbi:MAG TPA: hypothetical protein DDW52_20540 [Planctomycetaceae bacterium]|nr:hypothetical protein [Planctomycetaceae bacterium]
MGDLRAILSHPAALATVAVLAVSIIAVVGYYIAQRLRPATGTGDTNVEDLAANFAEMQREGDITDAELRRIQTVLGESKRPSVEE